MPRQKVIFLCTGNSARSQMAEALLRKHGGDQFEVYSAGMEARGIHPYTLQVLQEAGVDTSGMYSKSVKEYMGRMNFDHSIIVCRRRDDNCPTTAPDAANRARWVFDDPVKFDGPDEEKLDKFRQVRDQIDARVQLFVVETTE